MPRNTFLQRNREIFLEMICMVSFGDGVWTRRKASQATSANLVRCSCGYFENVYDSFFQPVYGHTETTRKKKLKVQWPPWWYELISVCHG